VDIHAHVLHGLDDGPQSIDESLCMLQIAAANGTTDIVATPHADLKYQYDLLVVTDRIAELRAANREAIHIHRGCDFHLAVDNIRGCLNDPAKYSINGAGYLLVEFGTEMIPPNTEALFGHMMQAGLSPVITHPERNPLLRGRLDFLERWIEHGCYIQVTAQAVLGTFGQSARRSAHALLDKGMVHFIASDAHDERRRPPALREAYGYVTSQWGEDRAKALFVENPRRTLTGEMLVKTDSTAATQRSFLQRLRVWRGTK
jgi:protein-tyrosine phosphatase